MVARQVGSLLFTSTVPGIIIATNVNTGQQKKFAVVRKLIREKASK